MIGFDLDAMPPEIWIQQIVLKPKASAFASTCFQASDVLNLKTSCGVFQSPGSSTMFISGIAPAE